MAPDRMQRSPKASNLLGAEPRGGCFRYTAATVGALPLPQSALADPDLSTIARLAASGRGMQEDLDDIAARHLSLSEVHRRALVTSLPERAEDRS